MNLQDLISESSDFEIHNQHKLDNILTKLCEMVVAGKRADPRRWGMVAAAVLDPVNAPVVGVNYFDTRSQTRVHAERAALDAYYEKYGEIPQGSIIITTCSPCSATHMEDRLGQSCTELINETPVRKVYVGFEDPTQNESPEYLHKKFHVQTTRNPRINKLCERFARTFI